MSTPKNQVTYVNPPPACAMASGIIRSTNVLRRKTAKLKEWGPEAALAHVRMKSALAEIDAATDALMALPKDYKPGKKVAV